MSDNVLTTFLIIAPHILTLIFVVLAVIGFRKPIVSILDSLAWRLKSGAAVKTAWLELGESYLQPGKGEPRSTEAIAVKADSKQQRE